MLDIRAATSSVAPQSCTPEELPMVNQESWSEIRRLRTGEGLSVSELARRFELDRKTVRRCLESDGWHIYKQREPVATLLTPHREYLERRAPEVCYSARILYQELRAERGYTGSYETVKRFVAPLRAERTVSDVTQTRFETPPGLQSQIDWGEGIVRFRSGSIRMHFFILTLGYSRRGFYRGYPDERLGQFLDAHEQAFDHFGGHTMEHLYDRPRTVCAPDGRGGKVWNGTFLEFSRYWGFEPRLCRPYRAQTKGKVESGVKYVKHNFLPGRIFQDVSDFDEQLTAWTTDIADVRIHGTTHERPIDRFLRERDHLIPTAGQPAFLHQARSSRIVAEDWLVSFRTNRYSVPFPLIGRVVEVEPSGNDLRIYHRGDLVAAHELRSGKYELAILPEHGPGAVARNARSRRSTVPERFHDAGGVPDVEVRDLAIYEQLAEVSS